MLKRISVESVLVMFLFIVFASSIGMLIVEGQASYNKIISEKESNENRRIAFSYISKKIKQNDFAGNIQIVKQPYNNGNAIKIELQGIEEGYVTYIFCVDNELYELYISEEDPFDKELGEIIIKLEQSLNFVKDSDFDLIHIKNEDEIVTSISLQKEVDDEKF